MAMRDGRRASRTLGALVLAVLLLVPLAFGGHSHANHRPSATCATCVAAHHTPSVAAPTLGVAPSPGPEVVVAAAAPVVSSRHHRLPFAGRAPPSSPALAV
jgi:hypothetical protein